MLDRLKAGTELRMDRTEFASNGRRMHRSRPERMSFKFLAMPMTWRSPITTEPAASIKQETRSMTYPIDNLPPIHPGSFLRDELEALGVSARTFAVHIHVPHNAVTGIMNGERAISAQMAIRLGQAFGTTPHYWLNLQSIYDLKRHGPRCRSRHCRSKHTWQLDQPRWPASARGGL
jgi:addiction module HigA family antidote